MRATAAARSTPGALNAALGEAEAAAATQVATPTTKASLFADYARLGAADVTATAALLEAEAALATGPGPDQRRRYTQARDRALAALELIGAAYAVRTDIFGKTVHGASCWPVRFEEGVGGRRRYINTFKSAEDLPFEKKAAIYAGKVEKFASEGGDFANDILEPKSLDDLQPGVRYDYCLLEDGTLRCAARGPDLPDPGHAILAEGGPEFKDTRVAMAGELWVVYDDRGGVAACVVACNSGHFKPLFEDLDRAADAAAALGVPASRVIPYGGPNNASAVLPEIGEKLGRADVSADLPMTIDARRAQLRSPAAGALKLWHR